MKALGVSFVQLYFYDHCSVLGWSFCSSTLKTTAITHHYYSRLLVVALLRRCHNLKKQTTITEVLGVVFGQSSTFKTTITKALGVSFVQLVAGLRH